jgi:dihydropteroate synthase
MSFTRLRDLPPTAQLYVAPTGFNNGVRLVGGLVRFKSVEISARVDGKVVYSFPFPLPDLEHVLPGLVEPLRTRFRKLYRALAYKRPDMVIGGSTLSFARPSVMGILNVTPDSFSDGGRHATPDAAAAAAVAMHAAGAALIDIGGESTRPGAAEVPEAEELARVGPVLDRLAGAGLPLSIDTRRAAVMTRALGAGAGLVNDVSALTHDPAALEMVRASGLPVVLMHAQGTPQSMQKAPHYDDCLRDVFDWLEARLNACIAAGIPQSRIIIDPGIGFGKTIAHNLELIAGIGMLHALGSPILLGVSRKKLIGVIDGDVAAQDRLGGSLALAVAGLEQGVQLLRVHDVPATVQAVRVWTALREA